MKAFNTPAIEVLKFQIADVITTSSTGSEEVTTEGNALPDDRG